MASKTNQQYVRFGIGFGILVAVLSVFWLYNAWPLLTGTTVVLDTRPVDPFDPLRGQYMVINYEIGSINESFEPGQTVYVSLEPDTEGIWHASSASQEKPATGVFLKGTAERFWTEQTRVRYGIEQFFFERDADVPTTNITVEVKVDSSGRARIVQLLQNGEPVEIEYQPVKLTD